MLQRAVNYWKGHVKLRVVSGFPERVLNICAARQIPFWGLEWEDDLTFTFTMTRKDYARLQKAAERMDCTIHVVEKEGMPYLLRRFRRRYALVIGLGLCLTLSLSTERPLHTDTAQASMERPSAIVTSSSIPIFIPPGDVRD